MIFAFAPYVTIHWLGHQNLVTLWFLPLFVLFLIRTVKESKWHWPLLAGAVAGLASLNDFYNFIFLFIFSLLFIFWLVIAQQKQINWRLMGKRILVGGLVWLALWSIWVIPAIQAVLQGQYGPIMTIEQISAYYSADPLRYFTPSFLNPILGRLASVIPGRFSGGVEGTIFLGYTPMIIVVVFLIHRFRNKLKDIFFPSVWFWIITIISFGLLSLGPYLKVAERITAIPLSLVLRDLPALGQFSRSSAIFVNGCFCSGCFGGLCSESIVASPAKSLDAKILNSFCLFVDNYRIYASPLSYYGSISATGL
jgi:hypothetical protein